PSDLVRASRKALHALRQPAIRHAWADGRGIDGAVSSDMGSDRVVSARRNGVRRYRAAWTSWRLVPGGAVFGGGRDPEADLAGWLGCHWQVVPGSRCTGVPDG